MALDDTCSDFFSLLDLTPKARPPDRRLNGCTGARSDFSCSILIATPITTANVDCALRRHSRRLGSPRHGGHLSTIAAVARALLDDGNYFPGSPQSDEAARWLNIVVDDIKSTTSLTTSS